MTNSIKALSVGIFCFVVIVATPARPEALLELKVKGDAYQGRLVAHDKDECWLMARDGRLHRLDLRQVGEHRSISPEFRRFNSGDIRDQLRREFGKEYEISGTAHFLVCTAPGRASAVAPLFEEVYRSFYRYLATRGQKVHEPEFPLVAIVFGNRAAFVKYAKGDGVSAARGLVGYYHPVSNRIALYDDVTEGTQAHAGLPVNQGAFDAVFGLQRREMIDSPAWHANIQANLQDTIVHETTHQVAFNAGLHSRIADNPRWIVEGIATVFESPGVRDSGGTTAQMRINRDRYVWFGNFERTRRKPKSLGDFISSDAMFNASPLDAYSQAWALTFFLVETRSADYSRYMKSVSARDPLKAYAAAERLADFKHAFGNDLDLLEAQFERFIGGLN